jgi:hypothetical protein
VYESSRSRTRDAPLTVLADYHGYVQADAYPGYDPLFVTGKINEAACNAHARRKFVEAADLLEKLRRPHEALAFYRELFRIERKIKDWRDEERLRERQDKTVPLLAQFKPWLDHAVHTVLPKDTFGIAVDYALNHWEALTNSRKPATSTRRTIMPSAACARWPLGERHFHSSARNGRVTPQRSTTPSWSLARRTRSIR